MSSTESQWPSWLGRLNSRLGSHDDTDAGSLVKQLGRQLLYARLYSVVMTVVFTVIVLLLVTKPTPVITVDASGKPVGHYEWFDASARNEYEVMASAKRFVQHYTSLNANTIFEDAALALNAMCESLKQSTQASWQSQGYLARIHKAGAVSRIQFDDNRSQLLHYEQGRASLRLIGTLVVGLKEPETTPFDIALELVVVPRTPTNTLGVEVCAVS